MRTIPTARPRGRRLVRTSTVTLAATALLLAACDGDADDDGADVDAVPEADDGGSDAPADEDQEPAAPGGEAAQVELLDPGAEPREEVRFAYAEGDLTTATISTVTEILASEVDGEDAGQADVPPIAIDIDVEVEVLTVDDSGAELRVASTGARVGDQQGPSELDDATHDQLEDELDDLTEFEVTYRIDDRGRASDVALDLDVPGLEGLGDQLDDLAAPLPTEPVGEGATWSVTQATDAGVGPTINQTTVYELVSRDGDTVELAAAITGDAEPGELEVPQAAGQDLRFEVVRVDLEGSGDLTLDLSSPFPTAAATTVGVDQELEIDDGTGPQVQRQVVEVRTAFSTD